MKQRRFYPVLLLFAVLLITAVFSCKQGSSPVKGSKVNHDSAFARYSIAQKLFNNNQHDSLLKVAPEILDFLRENQEWELYYILWQSVAEDHVWFNEFEEATQEAQAMQEDAIERNDSFGLALSYSVQGTAYTVQEVYDEATRCYKTFLQIYPKKAMWSPKVDVFGYYATCLSSIQDYNAIDSLLTEWDEYLSDFPDVADADDKQAYADWRLKYYRAKFSNLIAKGNLTQATQVLDTVVYFAKASGEELVEQINTIDNRRELAVAQGDYNAALHYVDEYLEHSKGDVNNRRQGMEYRSQILEKLGRYQEALEDLKTYSLMKDSLIQANNREQLNRLNKRFSLNELQSQNKLLAIERDHAEAASRAKTAFMQSMTHEIRTPLNAINGFTQVLTMKDIELPDAERMDFCERIQENTRLLTTILDDLILISDFESSAELPEPEPCLVSAITTQAIDVIRSSVAKTVALECQSSLPIEQAIDSYPRMIHTVLTKLLSNAAKFTTIGSITLKVDQEDDTLHFTVVDTGPGIPPDKKDYIFERFTKLDSFVQGTGLGLTIARMIAERIGGTLTLDTDYTNGAKFDFILPIK